MKKWFLILSLLSIVIFVNADTRYYKGVSFSCKMTGSTWGKITNSEIAIEMNNSKKRITIYSQTLQTFDYESFKQKKVIDGTIFSSLATDSKKNKVMIEFYSYNSHKLFLKIQYQDTEYRYELIECESP